MQMLTSRFLAPLCACVLTGCAGYQLGPTGGQIAGARSIQVPVALNQTLEPRLAEPVTQSLRRRLQEDGTLRLHTGRDNPDLLLQTILLEFQRLPTAYQRRDIASVQEYEIRITARIVVTEPRSGKTLLDQPVTGRTTVLAGASQSAVENQATPLLADDLARKAVILITEGAW
jgi:hypothetical protein